MSVSHILSNLFQTPLPDDGIPESDQQPAGDDVGFTFDLASSQMLAAKAAASTAVGSRRSSRRLSGAGI